jgi:hypothetical protein
MSVIQTISTKGLTLKKLNQILGRSIGGGYSKKTLNVAKRLKNRR